MPEIDRRFAIKKWHFETQKHPKTRFWSLRNCDLRRFRRRYRVMSRNIKPAVMPMRIITPTAGYQTHCGG